MLQSLILSILSQSSLSPTTLLRYVRLPLFSGDYCMVTSGQKQRTSVPRHGQRLRFRPCTPLIAHPYTPRRHLGAQRLCWCAPYAVRVWYHKVRQSLVGCSCVHAALFLPPPHQGTGCILASHPALVSLLTGLQTGKSRARKAHISQSASCSDTELRLCLNNLYLPPDTRIDIIWVPGTAALPTRSEAP